MAFERVGLFTILELHYMAVAGATVTFLTDQPGDAMAARGPALVVPASNVRRTVKFRLVGTIKGRLYSVSVASTGVVILYGGRVYARPLGLSQAEWTWLDLPITPTSNQWESFPLPIAKTGEWQEFPLPIPKTGEWEDIPLPIPKTGDWQEIALPMKKTPELYSWADVPVAK